MSFWPLSGRVGRSWGESQVAKISLYFPPHQINTCKHFHNHVRPAQKDEKLKLLKEPNVSGGWRQCSASCSCFPNGNVGSEVYLLSHCLHFCPFGFWWFYCLKHPIAQCPSVQAGSGVTYGKVLVLGVLCWGVSYRDIGHKFTVNESTIWCIQKKEHLPMKTWGIPESAKVISMVYDGAMEKVWKWINL
jgi:hypothetical protein